ncbi:MAG TPA: hypothetical protein VGH55_08600 [Chthoniobacterales bacterium]|jgi:hypothetical protein
MRAQSVAATGQATLLLGQEKVLRVDSIVAKGVFGLDKLTPDKLLAAASHQSLHRAREIQTRFLSHRAPEFRPCYAL